MNDTAKLPFLARSLFCCLLSVSQHVPSFFLPGNLAWANFYHFLYLSGIFSLPRERFMVKGQMVFCICPELTCELTVLDLACVQRSKTSVPCVHTVRICTSLTRCLVVWQAWGIPHMHHTATLDLCNQFDTYRKN